LNDFNEISDRIEPGRPDVVMAELVPEPRDRPPLPPYLPRYQRRVIVPALLFVATCVSTFLVAGIGPFLYEADRHGLVAGLWTGLVQGLWYSVPVMTILVCHEMGHFVQAWRYGVYASLPYFLPVPLPPIGTFGAVIAMEPRKGDRRALFDIGISGPLAGLVPTIIFLLVGLHFSHVAAILPDREQYGNPLFLRWLSHWYFGAIPAEQEIVFHPMAFAGWVGLLITSINLIPIGQLDGGHVLYGLLRKRAHTVAMVVMAAAVVAVLAYQLYSWVLMLTLLMFMGPRHPPTADDNVPLGPFRYLLGVLVLAFIPFGFTPEPIKFPDAAKQQQAPVRQREQPPAPKRPRPRVPDNLDNFVLTPSVPSR
jgi:Zn-dependent protease